MDFIRQMRGFRRQRLLNPIAANSICLYLILFEYDNDLGFLDWFTAPNSTLQGLTGLSLKSIQRARNELIQKGYIQYRAGKGSAAGKYKLCDLTVHFDRQTVRQMSNNMSENMTGKAWGNMSTLNNGTKRKRNHPPSHSPKGETEELPAGSEMMESLCKAGNSAGHSTTPAMQGFEEFWREYPKKIGKGAAERAWKKIQPDKKLIDEILSALRAVKQTDQWRRENGQYIPNPSTWLNQRRWEDEVPTPALENNRRSSLDMEEIDRIFARGTIML